MLVRQGFHGRLDSQYARVSAWRTTKQELVPRHIVTHSRRLLYAFNAHFHPYVERLLAELVMKDVDGLQDLDTAKPELREVFFDARYKPTMALAPTNAADFGTAPVCVLTPFPDKELEFDYQQGAYAVYNWEVFFHLPYAVALQLSKNQRFAEAQRWFHYIFDPTANNDDPAPMRFWRFKPFHVDEVQHVEKTLLNLSTGDDLALQDSTIDAIGQWRDNPFRPHLVARTRPTAYMYATVMAYLDNLIAWGDSLFRQDTRESINEAMQYYVLAANILGPQPQAVPRKGTLARQTYESLRNDLDEFGNAARELEAEIPFDLTASPPPLAGSEQDAVLESLGRSLYFCVPRNDKLLGYWSTVGDRLYKIRNSLNIDGVFRQLPLFPPPIDPAMLARAVAAGVDVASIIAGTAAPLGPVRFQTMLQKSLELCQEVKSLGGQILSAIEKKDNETLAVLRAKHEANLLKQGESVRYAQWQEAVKNKEGLLVNLNNSFQRFSYYDRLLGREASAIKLPDYEVLDATTIEGRNFLAQEPVMGADDVKVELGQSFRDGGHKISPAEAQEINLLEITQLIQEAGTVLDAIGAIVGLIPSVEGSVEPIGLGAAAEFGGEQLRGLFQGLAAVSRGVGARMQYEATLAGKMASYDRREQDWAFQRKLAAGEMTQLYKQIRGAEIREYIAKREYDNQQTQLAQAKDVEDFLTNEKRKTTTEAFHLWTKREAQGLHAQYFQFAYEIAKRAERALQTELGKPDATFVRTSYLAGREGLFAGEKLQLDLKRMELAFAELNTREFELTKHISLRDWFPLALMDLRKTGGCSIQIPEALFDLDCPGHYYRRIKSVAVTIPSVVGPQASLNCALTLQDNYIRTTANAPAAGWYADPTTDSDRFASYRAAQVSIVTSGAQSDSGMFETNLRDERPLPFELAGVFGTWNIALLGDPRPFDYDTIADVILTVRYTARPGAIPATVSAAVLAWLKANSARLFSMRHEFSSEFAKFQKTPVAAGEKAKLSFELKAEHFPYRLKDALASMKVKRVHIRSRTQSGLTSSVELRKGNAALATTTLAAGIGELVPKDQNDQPVPFDPRGTFELRVDTASFDDLWLVFDFS